MKIKQKNNAHRPAPNKLCTSCRRTCKQAGNAIVAKCPRYYPINYKQSKHGFTWKQMDLGF